MTFKELKQGYTLHILDKSSMTYLTEKITNVSLPHVDAKMTSTGMVVDITTESGVYCTIADTDVAYPINKVIATDRQSILREVEAMRSTSEQVLSQREHHEQMVTKCNQLIADLDPQQKEKQANEARFNNIEASIQQMMSMLRKITE